MDQCFFTSRNSGAMDRKYSTNNIVSSTVTRPELEETSSFNLKASLILSLLMFAKLFSLDYNYQTLLDVWLFQIGRGVNKTTYWSMYTAVLEARIIGNIITIIATPTFRLLE